MLGGILTPTSGELRVMGYDYNTHKEEAKRVIGYLSGNTKLYGRLSPREVFRIFGELYNMSKSEIEESIEYITLGLDVLSSQDIINFMKEEKSKGKLILYSTHYMEEAESLCDQLLMIHKGKIIAHGTPKALKEEAEVDNLRDVFIQMMDRGQK